MKRNSVEKSIYEQLFGNQVSKKYKKVITDKEFDQMLLENNDDRSIEDVNFSNVNLDFLKDD